MITPGPGDYEFAPRTFHPHDPRNGPADYLNDDDDEFEEEDEE